MGSKPELRQFDLAALAQFDDARLAKAVNRELDLVGRDMAERPGDDRERTVTIQLGFKPVRDAESGAFDRADFKCSVTHKTPKRESPSYQLRGRANGKLVFRPENPQEVDQPTLFDEEDHDQGGEP